jgi:hypothetical protein
MALARWKMIRDIISCRKSGTLILQMGRHYIHFVIEEGILVFVSSTLPEFTFSYFLIQNAELDARLVVESESQVSENRSLGTVLVQCSHLPAEEVRHLLRRHWHNLAHHLMQSNAHAFWSNRVMRQKPQMIDANLPLSQLLLRCERSSIEVQIALRFLEIVPERCKVADLESVEEALQGIERRILPYLRAGTTLEDILKDPELDRMTCYRILFQLWVAGYLQDGYRKRSPDQIKPQRQLLQRIRSLPPDWIIPLAMGALIGVLLAPTPDAPSPPEKRPKVEKPWDPPSWQSNQDKGNEKEDATDG